MQRRLRTTTPPSTSRTSTGFQGLPVLVVDDNEDAATAMATLLGLDGARVDTAFSGRQALEVAQGGNHRVVLLDLAMPDMTGYEVAEALRKLPGGESLVLIALTGSAGAMVRRRGKESGFDHQLVKPADLAALRGILAQIAQRAAD